MNRPLKVFLCHIIPLWDAHADRDPVHALYTCLTKVAKVTLRAKNPFIRYAIR